MEPTTIPALDQIKSWLPRLGVYNDVKALPSFIWELPDMPQDIVEIVKLADGVLYTGSHFTVSPPPDPVTDIDIMLWGAIPNALLTAIKDSGATHTQPDYPDDIMPDYPDDIMLSFRIREFNILVALDEEYFRRWMVATDIATHLNLKSKNDRAYLFERITTM